MASARLPGKVLLEVLGKPLLAYHLERLRRARRLSEIVVATTTREGDQAIVDLSRRLGFPVFRGPEDDVLRRYAQTATAFAADVVVRVTSDCPLIDPAVVDRTVSAFLDRQGAVDYVSNRLPATFPRGMDTEVLSREALDTANREATEPDDREHVTLFVWRQPERFRVYNEAYHRDESRHRWTVDEPADFVLIKRMLETLVPRNSGFTLEDCLALMREHPEWPALNAGVEQRISALAHEALKRGA
jgi:spore coat polysaccharide biosynthesis protein SpsF